MRVRVQPRAKREGIDGIRNGALRIRLNAPPVDGAANERLIAFLAERLELPRSAFSIVSGHKGREKTVRANRATAARLDALLD